MKRDEYYAALHPMDTDVGSIARDMTNNTSSFYTLEDSVLTIGGAEGTSPWIAAALAGASIYCSIK